ncbi:MAG TPA: SURF1 family protein [Anaerolineales bacterium]|nr:SURF1 family protein [Anaerolineales bacterium]
MFLLKMFSRRWWLATLLVFCGTAILIRLGLWQLDRLDQRRDFNAQVESARSLPVLDLNKETPSAIEEMEWRFVQIVGEYDFGNQVALRNQYYGERYGYHLLTPFHFNPSTGSRQAPTVVLVDRGWIPAEGNSTPADWRRYDDPREVTVTGQIRLGQGKPAYGGVADVLPVNGTKLEIWNNADVEHIANQLPYPVLPIYIQPKMDESDIEPPIPFQPEVELTEGPHFGYALQWFTFASILFFGYPFFLRKQESEAV